MLKHLPWLPSALRISSDSSMYTATHSEAGGSLLSGLCTCSCPAYSTFSKSCNPTQCSFFHKALLPTFHPQVASCSLLGAGLIEWAAFQGREARGGGCQAQRGLSPLIQTPSFQRGKLTPREVQQHPPRHTAGLPIPPSDHLKGVRMVKPVSGCVRGTGCRDADAQLTGDTVSPAAPSLGKRRVQSLR